MALIRKAKTGLIFEEDFNNINLLWNISPNDYSRIEVNENGTVLRHGVEKLSMSLQAPSYNQYVFQTEIEHTPTTLSDVAGVVVLSTTNDSIECQSYFDPYMGTSQYYKYLKVICNNERYTFIGSKDKNTWYEIGNSYLPNANRIGYFIDGVKLSNSSDLLIKNVYIYESNIITIDNVYVGSEIELLVNGIDILKNNNKITVNKNNSKIYLDFKNYIFPIKNATIKLYLAGNMYSEIKNIDLYGGDIFILANDISLYLDNKLIDTSNIFDLGYINYKREFDLMIVNKEIFPLENKKLKIVQASEYYKGEDLVELSFKDSDVYSSELDLPVIQPNSFVEVKMRIKKDISNKIAFYGNKYKFKIVLE